jgi:hypothetical protein
MVIFHQLSKNHLIKLKYFQYLREANQVFMNHPIILTYLQNFKEKEEGINFHLKLLVLLLSFILVLVPLINLNCGQAVRSKQYKDLAINYERLPPYLILTSFY